MIVRPVNDYVLVERDKPPSITNRGLIIPPNAQSIMKRGKVLAIGPGKVCPKAKRRMPMPDLKIGDIIVWVQQGVEKVFDEERNPHILVEAPYILAVVG